MMSKAEQSLRTFLSSKIIQVPPGVGYRCVYGAGGWPD